MKMKHAITYGFLLPAIAGTTLGLLTGETGQVTDSFDSAGSAESQVRNLTALSQSRDPRFQNRIERLDSGDFPQLIEELRALPSHQRGLAIEIGLASWAKRDPQAAADFLHGPSGGDTIPVAAHRAVYRVWASIDLEAALASVLPSPKEKHAAPILELLCKTDPARAWETLSKVRSNDGRYSMHNTYHSFHRSLFEHWITQDPAAARDAALGAYWETCSLYYELIAERYPEQIPDLVETGGASGPLHYWRKHDPEAAGQFVRSMLSEPPYDTDSRALTLVGKNPEWLSDEQLRIVADVILEGGDESAVVGRLGPSVELQLRMYQEIEELRSRSVYVETLAYNLAYEDPQSGLVWLETLPPDLHSIRSEFFSTWYRLGTTTFMEHFENRPPSEDLFRMLQDDRTDNDHELWEIADRWYDSITPEKRGALIEEMPEKVISRDPLGVIDWSLQQSLDNQVGNLSVRALGSWFESEPEESINWLLQEAEPATRDQFLARLEVGILGGFPVTPGEEIQPDDEPEPLHLGWEVDATAFDLATNISDPELRSDTLRRLVTSGEEYAVQSMLDESELPADLRAEMQELIDLGEAIQPLRTTHSDPHFGDQ